MWRQDLNQCQHYHCQHFCLQQCDTHSVRTTTVSISVYSNATHTVSELPQSAFLSTAMRHTQCQNYHGQHFCLQQCDTHSITVSELLLSAFLSTSMQHMQSISTTTVSISVYSNVTHAVSELPLSALLYRATEHTQSVRSELPLSALLYRATEHTQSVRSELPLSALLSSAMRNKQECQNGFCN